MSKRQSPTQYSQTPQLELNVEVPCAPNTDVVPPWANLPRNSIGFYSTFDLFLNIFNKHPNNTNIPFSSSTDSKERDVRTSNQAGITIPKLTATRCRVACGMGKDPFDVRHCRAQHSVDWNSTHIPYRLVSRRQPSKSKGRWSTYHLGPRMQALMWGVGSEVSLRICTKITVAAGVIKQRKESEQFPACAVTL